MRRLLLPILLLAIAIAGLVQTNRANEDADPGRATEVSGEAELATPLLSARRAPEWLRSPESDELLTDAISSVLATGTTPSTSCVLVERAGEQLAGSNLGVALPTAELHRLVTASVIDAAGSGSGFRTEIAISTEAVITVDEEDGTAELEGDIWIIGGGDPGLATRAYADRFDNARVFTDFDQLATDALAWLQERNIVSVQGRIIGDESKYAPNERDYYGASVETADGDVDVWDRSGGETNEVGPLSALLLNDGFVGWPEDVIDPTLNERASNPSQSAAAFFDDILEFAGITVLRSAQDGVAPPIAERETLAVIDSPPLDDIIASSLVDATTAEMLLKEYGIRSGTSAEREAVIFALAVGNGFNFAGLPFDITTTAYLDGSGRSTLNATTCEMIHATVVDPDGVGNAVIPRAADGPVARCAGSADDDLHVFAVAKGSTTGLTGWFDAPNGERLTFTMLADDPSRLVVAEDAPEGTEPVGPYEFCNPLQAAMLDAITGHPYGPDLDDLAPVSPAG
ncbi:MAG: D-alanyl-D-alanine carboxypeptidase [Actinomycetota bacterium]